MEKKERLPLIYILGVPAIFIFANIMTYLKINILGSPLCVSVFFYPLMYLVTGIIIKKSDYKKALIVMLLGFITEILVSVMTWILFDWIDGTLILYSLVSFIICQIIFIYVYDFLIKTKKDTYIPVFLLLAVIEVIDHAFFGPILEGQAFSISILVRVVYAVFMPVILARKTSK